MSSPDWLDSSYFEEILKKNYKNTSIKVHEIRIEPCGAANDGFLSTLLRVHVNYLINSELVADSFVVKMATSHEFTVEKVGTNGYDVQNKEMLFYELIAPQIEKALRKIGEAANLMPKVIAVDRCNEAIVFEDLRNLNFDMVDRLIGLNETQTQIALQKLAKFHASSLIVKQKHPKAFEKFDVGMFSRKVDAFNYAHQSIFKFGIEEIKTWPGFSDYAVKMEKLHGSLIEKAIRCFDNDTGDFCVLNHGDVWTNNLMFDVQARNKCDVILIDFQFCHWASPALDLIHFLYTSLSDDLYNQASIEGFVQFFYYELKAVLVKLTYDLNEFPSLHQFQMQFRKKMFYGLIYTIIVYPIMISDDADNDFIAHHSSDERATNFKRRVLKNPKYQRAVKKMLPVYDRMGLLE